MNPKIENNIDWRMVHEICGGDKNEELGVDYEKFIEEMRKSHDLEDDDSMFSYLEEAGVWE
jgi:hypothetical protein